MPTLSSKTIASLAAGDYIPFLQDQGGGVFVIRRFDQAELASPAGELTISQAAHGLSVGDVVRHNGTSYAEATADTAGNAVVAGIVTAVADVDTFTLTLTGQATGLSGLTSGSIHYLQDAGGLGTTAGTVEVPVLLATSTTAGILITVNAASSGSSGVTQIPLIVACSDETTDLTTGTAKVTFRMPFAGTLDSVKADLTEAPTGSGITVDINEAGTSVLSTKLTVDATEDTSVTAATAAVISDSALANNAKMTIDLDAVGSTTPGKGLKVTLMVTPA